ncbi:MAG: hypothetical protein COV47_04950 [Candidatus Diapherotrites archaeon CG11_big_fil_rev_8_21_14_0_20_37_9]|nr:MAG: hypothetical protein COV47_04950 [Candidatus Diapherotrites archaeon CG11_big_fil_rev_8_21_14_0_20_37_9]
MKRQYIFKVEIYLIYSIFVVGYMFENLVQKIKDIYFTYEDNYYVVLDKIDPEIPVYQIVDRIDKYVPSFLLLLVFIFLFLVGISFLVLGFVLGFGAPAKLVVVDSNSNPVGGAGISIVGTSAEKSLTTDDFGEAITDFFGSDLTLIVSKSGYEDFESTETIEPGKEYLLTLDDEKPKIVQVNFELKDSATGNKIPGTSDVSMSFSCTRTNSSPSSFSKSGSNHSVSVQVNCGSLQATINVIGFNEKVQNVSLASLTGVVSVSLSKKNLFGKVAAFVKDAESGDAIEGVTVKVKSGASSFAQGTSDASGSKLFDKIPTGSYKIEVIPSADMGYPISTLSDDFTVNNSDIQSGTPVRITVEVQRLSLAKKIILKFVDNETTVAIAGVRAILVIDDIYNESLVSTSDSVGELKFINLEEEKDYAVIATHPDYVLKVVEPELKEGADNVPDEVKLKKATLTTAGTVKIIVNSFVGDPIANADTELYSADHVFPIVIGKTDGAGINEIKNLPPSNYKAKAQISLAGVNLEGESSSKDLAAGTLIELPITLVVSNGELQVEVKEGTTKIVTADVLFVDSLTGKELASAKTSSTGKTEYVEFKIDKRPYVIVTKQGYYPFISSSYPLTAGSKDTIKVHLRKLEAFSDFDVELVDILGSNGGSVNKLDESKDYSFVFNILVASKEDNVSTVVRSGLEENLDSADSVIAINGFSGHKMNYSLYTCFTPGANYAECSPGDADAKQLIASFGDLDAGVYEFVVKLHIKDVEGYPGDNVQVPIEVRYGAKSESAFKPIDPELYLWRAFLGEAFCLNNCGIVFDLSLMDVAGEIYPEWVSVGAEVISLITGEEYLLKYRITNQSGSSFDNVELSVMNKGETFEVRDITADNVTATAQDIEFGKKLVLGSFGNNFSYRGQTKIFAKTDTSVAVLDLNLNTPRTDDGVSAIFSVSALRPLTVKVNPPFLVPDRTNNAVVQVLGEADPDNPVPVVGADITITNGAGESPVVFGTTNENGLFFTEFAEYPAGTLFNVKAEKVGFIAQSVPLPVTYDSPDSVQVSCVTIDGAAIDTFADVIATRTGASSEFLLENGCGTEVEIVIAKHVESDMKLQKDSSNYSFDDSFVLPEADSVVLKVPSDGSRKVFGVHPLYFKVDLKDGVGFQDAGISRVVIFNASGDSCLYVGNVGADVLDRDRFTVDVSRGTGSFTIINRCYSGFEGSPDKPGALNLNAPEKYPNFPDKIDPKLQFVFSLNDRAAVEDDASLRINVRNTALTGKEFFLITVRDYIKEGN